MKIHLRACKAAAAMLMAAPICANAGPARAGLWEVTTSLNFDLGGYQISEEQAAQIRQFGFDIPGLSKPFVARQCVTPEQAAKEGLPRPQTGNSGCRLRNLTQDGPVWRSDISCDGNLQGTGAMVARFANAQAFKGTWEFKGHSSQLPTELNLSNPFSGRWLGEDCGAVKPLR